MDRYRNPLFVKEIFVRQLAISTHLLFIFVFNVREKLASALLGRFERCNPKRLKDRSVALRRQRRSEVDERSCHLAPVAKFDRAFSQAATGDDGNRISGAAINLDKSY